ILSPIYHATIALQNRHTTISTVIPLFRVIVHKLEKDQENYPNIKETIVNGLKSRMEEKRDIHGNIKRTAWNENRDLIISTLLDARFKLSTYFDVERQEEYKNWLITEAEKVIQIQARVSDQSNSSSTKICAVADLFNEYERDNEMEN
uniref:Uncharacterized protein n=1 Tax=Meloidogyne javanica TaxID=6303 RepID=A0A915LSN4_MELJA